MKTDNINKQILELLSQGLSAKQIAPFVLRTRHTVEQRILAMRKDTGAKNVTHLTSMYCKKELEDFVLQDVES